MPTDNSTPDRTQLVEDGILPRFGVITWLAVDSDEFRALRGASVRVYMALVLFADAGGSSYPRQRTISDIVGMTRTTVNHAITELCDAGLLKREAIQQGRIEMVKYTIIKPPSKR